MFILKKIFQLRDHANSEAEKPFLEHLEDLRVTITKIVVTLVISMTVCFSFQDKLMNVLRRPIEQVWYQHQQTLLPEKDKLTKPLTVEIWQAAKQLERAVAPLDTAEKQYFYHTVADESLVFHSKAVSYLRSVLCLDEGKRANYIAGLPITEEMKGEVRALLETKANPEPQVASSSLSSLRPTETFMLSMSLSFFAGIVVAFPLLLYFILQFILPGLHGHEKNVLWPALAIGFGLFLGGVLFAYFLVLPRALVFFFEWGNDMGISNDWRIGEYISFATQFTLRFGASFELPVVVMVLVKLGLLGYETMKKTRTYAIVAIFIIAAVLTPTPDIFTQCLMACPMLILYEGCIWLAWWDGKKQAKKEAAEAEEEAQRRKQQMIRLLEEHEDLDLYGTEGDEHQRFHDDPHEEIPGDHPQPPVDHDPDSTPKD
jgi:sec-independent protein translocase protein TatC